MNCIGRTKKHILFYYDLRLVPPFVLERERKTSKKRWGGTFILFDYVYNAHLYCS